MLAGCEESRWKSTALYAMLSLQRMRRRPQTFCLQQRPWQWLRRMMQVCLTREPEMRGGTGIIADYATSCMKVSVAETG